MNAAAAKAIREAGEGVPETLAWVFYDCANRVEREGFDYAARSVISTVSIQFHVRDQRAWQESKVQLLNNLVSTIKFAEPG